MGENSRILISVFNGSSTERHALMRCVDRSLGLAQVSSHFPAVDARIVHGDFAHGIGAITVFEMIALSQCGRRCWPCKARTVHYKYVYLSFGQHVTLCGHQRLST